MAHIIHAQLHIGPYYIGIYILCKCHIYIYIYSISCFERLHIRMHILRPNSWHTKIDNSFLRSHLTCESMQRLSSDTTNRLLMQINRPVNSFCGQANCELSSRTNNFLWSKIHYLLFYLIRVYDDHIQSTYRIILTPMFTESDSVCRAFYCFVSRHTVALH